jgi:hypothetical protein
LPGISQASGFWEKEAKGKRKKEKRKRKKEKGDKEKGDSSFRMEVRESLTEVRGSLTEAWELSVAASQA